jgi:hypothetical protein
LPLKSLAHLASRPTAHHQACIQRSDSDSATKLEFHSQVGIRRPAPTDPAKRSTISPADQPTGSR